MNKKIILITTAAAALTLTGCSENTTSSSSGTPDVDQLLYNSYKASKEQKAVSFKTTFNGKIQPKNPDDPKWKTGTNTKIIVDGGISEKAFKIAANITGIQDLPALINNAQIQADENELAIKFQNKWFTSKQYNLKEIKKLAEQQAQEQSKKEINPDKITDEKVKAGLMVYRPQIMNAKVEEDGDNWKIPFTLNSEGIIKLQKENSKQQFSEDEQNTIKLLADHTNGTIIINKENNLIKSISMNLKINEKDVPQKMLDQTKETNDVQQLEADLTIEMFNWGQDIQLDKPENPTPLEQLFGSFLGAMEPEGTQPETQTMPSLPQEGKTNMPQEEGSMSEEETGIITAPQTTN